VIAEPAASRSSSQSRPLQAHERPGGVHCLLSAGQAGTLGNLGGGGRLGRERRQDARADV
jgi:hypothetical protein